jgi:hypothetical protein
MPLRSAMHEHLGSFVLGVALLLVSARVQADEVIAAEFFRAGVSSYAKGDFRAAARLFERAHHEEPRGAAIFNAGRAWDAAGDAPRAADAYATALRVSDLATSQAAEARGRLDVLEKTLGRLEVTAPVGTTIAVAHVEAAACPITIHLPPGAHVVTVRLADGSTSTRSVTLAAAASVTFSIESPDTQPVDRSLAPAGVVSAPSRAAVERRPGSGRRIVGFALLGAGGVAATAAVVLGVSALSAKSDFDASGHRDQSAHDRAASLRAMTNIAWVAAGVLGASGIVVVFTSP